VPKKFKINLMYVYTIAVTFAKLINKFAYFLMTIDKIGWAQSR